MNQRLCGIQPRCKISLYSQPLHPSIQFSLFFNMSQDPSKELSPHRRHPYPGHGLAGSSNAVSKTYGDFICNTWLRALIFKPPLECSCTMLNPFTFTSLCLRLDLNPSTHCRSRTNIGILVILQNDDRLWVSEPYQK